MNAMNPLLNDNVQRIHRELNGEAHPPHYAVLADTDGPASPNGGRQRTSAAKISINLDSWRTRWADIGTDLGDLSVRLGESARAYWWVPAGFAVLVLVRSIVGG